MKKYLIIFICLLHFNVSATTYYFSSSTGSDGNSGTSSGSPYQTISKANSLSLSAGDQMLFKRGDTFYGLLYNTSSGSSGNPIIYGAYGSGANPIITGFSTLSGWTNYTGNIYSTSVPSNNTMIVLFNGNIVTMGRTPNAGQYYYYTTSTGQGQIGGTGLSGSPNWTGANIVMRNQRWIIDNFPVTSQSGGSINYNYTTPSRGSTDTYSPAYNGWFFIQNDLRTVDTTGEWYTGSGTFYFDFGTYNPAINIVQASLQDYNINLHYDNYITIQNIDITGASVAGINLDGNIGITINGMNSTAQGGYMMNGGSGSKMLVENCTSTNSLAGGIHLDGTQVNIYNSNLTNNGLAPGNAFSGDGQGGAIGLTGNTDTIMYNTIKNSGYEGIKVMGQDVLVAYNRIDTFGLLKTDVGGIYNSNAAYTNMKIYHNIVSNGIGTGSFDHVPSSVVGIYCDNASHSGFVVGNTVFNIDALGLGGDGEGLFSQYDGYDWTMDSNKVYNAQYGFYQVSYSGVKAHNMTFTHNVMASVNSSDPTMWMQFWTTNQRDSLFNTIDYNYYMQPITSDAANIVTDSLYAGDLARYYTISGWKSLSGKDAHSSGSPKFITSPDSMMLVYNPHLTDTTIALPYKYLGHDGTVFDGSITLHPFTSEILIQNGSKTGTAAPTISVSGNQIIITSSTSVYATATWASGHSGTYLWTQTAGTSATIGSPTASSTTLTGLTGHNTFKCTATQDDSQTANGSVNVYVDYATANAGGNQTITLPTSTVTLSGSGTSSDGTISSYWWTQISGPNSASFGTPALATTTATGLIQGTYVFNLLVTDSYGATANNTATITVNPAVPVIIPGTKITLYGVFKVIND